MNALVVVDIQNDFLPGGALAVPDGDAVIAIANRLMAHAPLVVATQDWHPNDHGSFAGNHPGKNPGDVIELAGLTQVLWPDHCIQDTHGAEFAETLNTTHFDRVFQKGLDPSVDSYSGFFDNNHQRSTGLGDYLKEKKVSRVFVLGLATDYCVKFTVLDSIKLGFETLLVQDGCRGVDLQEGDVAGSIREMENAGAALTDCTCAVLEYYGGG